MKTEYKRSTRTWKRYLGILSLLLLVLLLGYCIWPRSLEQILSAEGNLFSKLTIHAVDFESEASGLQAYSFESEKSEELRQLLEILARTKYHAGLRNLLPWPIQSVSSDGKGIEASAHIRLVSKEGVFNISFHGDSTVALSSDGMRSFRIYHIKDAGIPMDLLAFTKERGEAVE